MEINNEKREKFMEVAGKRVTNILEGFRILVPMAKSNTYDFTKEDIEDMFTAMQESLDETKREFLKKFEAKEARTKKTFSFKTITKNEDLPENEFLEESEEKEEI